MVSPTAALVGSFIRKLYSVREGLHGDVSEGVVWVSGEDGGMNQSRAALIHPRECR